VRPRAGRVRGEHALQTPPGGCAPGPGRRLVRPRRRAPAAAAALLATLASAGSAEVFLPGTQPREHDLEFAKVAQCRRCHGGTTNGDADPYFSWAGGMMAQAARDPVFRAAAAIANQDGPGVGEYCFRCHAPRAWISGRSTPPDGSALNREDMHGVSCDVCHRLVDPASPEAGGFARDVPPGHGNAMMVMDPGNVVRGPYGDGEGAMPHEAVKSAFHGRGELCGTCHDVSNPLFADDVRRQAPHAYGHVERTYSEWSLSAFPEEGQTCQSCHLPAVAGGGQASRYESPHREHFVRHGATGGSTWVQRATWHVWKRRENASDLRKHALERGIERNRELLRTAASLELAFPEPGRATLRVTNLSGHRFPTGYPEGRRAWVNARFLGPDGALLGEIGRYGEVGSTLRGEAVRAPTLIDPAGTRVYESLPGLSEAQAAEHGKKPGKSFHFVLNDVITKDNRIPPRGFTNAAFAERLAAPVGATYADGQHWDDVPLVLPEGTSRVEARLLYQSVSWEYLKFLVEENRTDEWGTILHEAWSETGRCAPESIAEVAADVPSRPSRSTKRPRRGGRRGR
jgi:hypothetical protein